MATAANDRGWVVDASVILKWSLRDSAEGHLEQADSLYEAFLSYKIDLIAPHYARYEVANGLEVACIQGRIQAPAAEERLDWFLRTPISDTEDDDSLLTDAMDMAQRMSIVFYDAMYVALSERLGYAFVTADQRLYKRIARNVPFATWIGDLPDFS
jgi:predicted nucleic acid-binding protein